MSTRSFSPAATPNQLLSLVFGAVYTLVGVVGFAITPGVGFAATHGKDLLIFGLNPLHNLVHIAIGLGLAAAAVAGPGMARAANTAVGGVYLAVGVVGLFLTSSNLNILALNGPDDVLHLATAAVLLLIGVLAPRRRTASA